ncbi:hypothetical protein B0H19DRAFT_1182396 [Mycena capillaripes]|nr:hypothetical protein B0H19DRAFT_1182396 [Mycena capillaripes]
MPPLIPYVLSVSRLLRDPCEFSVPNFPYVAYIPLFSMLGVLYQAALMTHGPLRKVHIFIFACCSFAHIALLNRFPVFSFYWVEVPGSGWIYLCRYR